MSREPFGLSTVPKANTQTQQEKGCRDTHHDPMGNLAGAFAGDFSGVTFKMDLLGAFHGGELGKTSELTTRERSTLFHSE